ncbi:peptidase P60 [Rhizobium sp. Leaf306]|uniref:NlpC/P60 family protein n=1 Tax=Rhizobium sp. Leaf306 TaxID=1736330 RepID=UPI0007159A9B|nr:NlpC/P60 family protein [Rhizobium sp. Leaf306]KQQ37829.1 peptidase P60 [Rhizobium sp. Leaf306]
MSAAGERIVAVAETWIGTPYRHQGATRGIGCDCIGLIRGIWRELYGEEPEPVAPYAPDWAERGGEDRLLVAGIRLFGPALGVGQMQPGDLLLFRWRPDTMVKHAGILAGPSHFIHAYEQMAVTRSVLVPSWRRKIAAVHRFPTARDEGQSPASK